MTRAAFVAASATSVVALQAANGTALATPAPSRTIPSTTETIQLAVNGTEQSLTLEPRVTLLDALRDRIGLTGTKKGCDQGTCGACTVLVNDRRINSCLTLAVMHEGDRITTIEGLATGRTSIRSNRRSSNTTPFSAATARPAKSAPPSASRRNDTRATARPSKHR